MLSNVSIYTSVVPFIGATADGPNACLHSQNPLCTAAIIGGLSRVREGGKAANRAACQHSAASVTDQNAQPRTRLEPIQLQQHAPAVRRG